MSDVPDIRAKELPWVETWNHDGWILKVAEDLVLFRIPKVYPHGYRHKLEIGVHPDWLKLATRAAKRAVKDSGYDDLANGFWLLDEGPGSLLAMQFCGWQCAGPKSWHVPLIGGWQYCKT